MSVKLLYLDSSALVKLVLPEPETEALIEVLSGWPERVTSVLARVEVPRAVRRASAGEAAYSRAENVVARIGLIRLDEEMVLGAAARLDPPELRSLDAIHLATALSVGDDLGAMISYDARLAEAARRSGINTLAPAGGG